MELGWFRKSPIADTLEGFVEARLHTDLRNNDELLERIVELQELYVGDVGLPNYVIVDPSDESNHGRYTGICVTDTEAEEFTEFLKKGRAEFRD